VTKPESGLTLPTMELSNVVFPQPLGPSNPKLSHTRVRPFISIKNAGNGTPYKNKNKNSAKKLSAR
jgi:hypothetical protein